MKRIFIMWAILGAAYVTLEVLWRGNTHPSMFFVGGLCGILVGAVNQLPRFYKKPVICQSVAGAVIVLIVEFLSGCILNLWLCLGVWDYSNEPGNILGQVCPVYGVFWVLLMPFAIWLEDTVRWLLWSWDKLLGKNAGFSPETAPYTLASIYGEFFSGK